jgi:hypothetical protein
MNTPEHQKGHTQLPEGLENFDLTDNSDLVRAARWEIEQLLKQRLHSPQAEEVLRRALEGRFDENRSNPPEPKPVEDTWPYFFI